MIAACLIQLVKEIGDKDEPFPFDFSSQVAVVLEHFQRFREVGLVSDQHPQNERVVEHFYRDFLVRF